MNRQLKLSPQVVECDKEKFQVVGMKFPQDMSDLQKGRVAVETRLVQLLSLRGTEELSKAQINTISSLENILRAFDNYDRIQEQSEDEIRKRKLN